jgi:hypothetical protein
MQESGHKQGKTNTIRHQVANTCTIHPQWWSNRATHLSHILQCFALAGLHIIEPFLGNEIKADCYKEHSINRTVHIYNTLLALAHDHKNFDKIILSVAVMVDSSKLTSLRNCKVYLQRYELTVKYIHRCTKA